MWLNSSMAATLESCEPVTAGAWFDGLGSAIIGGVVAALVAVLVTRTQLNHDRRMRRDEARDQAAAGVRASIGDLRPWNRTGLTGREGGLIRSHLFGLVRSLEVLRGAAESSDKAFAEWLTGYSRRIAGWAADPGAPQGGLGAAVVWSIRMAEASLERLRDPKATLPDFDALPGGGHAGAPTPSGLP